MATVFAPDDGGGDLGHPASSGYASGESASTKSPLAVGFGFLKGLTQSKNTRDGQPPKRRGPKPDSKPALTRRQELNRQAQRTHRERKEIYIKALEEQVMQLKETFTSAIQEKNVVLDENRKLKELLQSHGIPYNSIDRNTPTGFGNSYNGSSAGSRSGSYGYNQSFSPPHTVNSGGTPPASREAARAGSELIGGPQHLHQQHQQGGYDADQVGVDFVLALERPCMEHKMYMCVRSSQEPEPSPNGHALMASCPPMSHIVNTPEEPYPHKMPDMPAPDMMKLLTLSRNLVVDGEVTPVMALNLIRSHERFHELTLADFKALTNDLKSKSRCYGFGAVIEEFELRDALSSVFATKIESYAGFQ